MICACGNKEAYRLRFSSSGRSCDKCGVFKSANVPDVYFRRPYLDPHLVDTNDARQKDGVWIESKSQKKSIMDKLGVREMGDRHHGARTEFRRMEGAWKVP